MEPIKVLLADSNFIAREGLKTIFATDGGIEVVGEVSKGSELIDKHRKIAHDVLVIDYTAPGFSIHDIKQIRTMSPAERMVAITEFTHREQVREALRFGVSGHIQKDCSYDEIVDSVKECLHDKQYFCGKVLDVLDDGTINGEPATCDPISLSSREIEIIQKIAEGQTNKQIADELCLSAHTVMTHRKNIMNKLGLNNTAGIVIYAVRENLISPNKFLFNN